MKNEFQTSAVKSLFSTEQWVAVDYATVNSSDIIAPWRSTFGFPINAARLAANQPLVLHSREDEVFDLMARLNNLLGDRAVLNHSFQRLVELKEISERKSARLAEIEERPISEEEITEIVGVIETYLTSDNSTRTVLDRLEEILKPGRQIDEKVGLQKMLSRLETTMAALTQVKDVGFHVVVVKRQRQPSRPALEAHRYAPILNQGQPTGLNAGFLLPTNYHLTLWAYLVKRSDQGQSAIWN